jgi:hypothetical protein
MADQTTGGLDQAGIIAILERLGLGQFANQSGTGQGNLSQTVGGKPVQFDPGTINLSNGGSQGFTDQQLMQGLTQASSGNGGNGSGWSTSMSNGASGTGSTLQNDPAWWPKNNKELNAFYSAQTDFNRNQADSIAKLLGGLTQGSTATTAPINLGTQLNNRPDPNVAPVVNGPSGGFLDPTKAFIPGMNSAPPAPGSLPSLTAQPDALTQTAAKIDQQAALPSAPTLTVPQGQGAFPPFRPNMTASGLPSPGPGSLPSAPTASAPSVGNDFSNLSSGLVKAYQTYQQRTAAPDPSVRSYMPSDSQYNVMTPRAAAAQGGSIESNPAGYNNPGNVFVNQPGQPTVAYPDATATNTNGGTVVNNSATGTSTAIPDATASGAGMAGAGASAAGIGGAIGSGIQAIAAALTPKDIKNTAASNINANLLPRPIVFSAPQLTGR